MIDPRHIDYAAQAARAASNGSPAAFDAVGRLFGLGQNERDALASGGLPTIVWVVVAVGVGFVAGARVQNRWPRRMPKLISGA
jgi:hypothetical protein